MFSCNWLGDYLRCAGVVGRCAGRIDDVDRAGKHSVSRITPQFALEDHLNTLTGDANLSTIVVLSVCPIENEPLFLVGIGTNLSNHALCVCVCVCGVRALVRSRHNTLKAGTGGSSTGGQAGGVLASASAASPSIACPFSPNIILRSKVNPSDGSSGLLGPGASG
jgi:hypothetical protein